VETSTALNIAGYRLVQSQVPEPGEGEVLIRVAACGVAYANALMALGRHQFKPPLPHSPGSEIAGWIEAVGAGVSGFDRSDRVMAVVRGGFAEYVVCAVRDLVRVPNGMSLQAAAAFRNAFLTAGHALVDRAALRAGEQLLVLGAAGSVGSAAIQVGNALGARVIAAASSGSKREFAQALGADVVLDSAAEGWRERLKAACGGRGPDVIFDPVCGPLFQPSFRSLAWGGRHLVVGFASGAIPALPANLTLLKGAALMGVDLRQFIQFEPARARERLGQLMGWVEEGRLAPAIGRIFKLEEYAPALEYALSGQGQGQTLLSISGDCDR
jgi:NADPH2:quinone reductase